MPLLSIEFAVFFYCFFAYLLGICPYAVGAECFASAGWDGLAVSLESDLCRHNCLLFFLRAFARPVDVV